MKKDCAKLVKAKLTAIIEASVLNRHLYVVNPNTDFTRQRKLGLKSLVEFIIKAGSSSIQNSLIDHFKLSESLPTSAAFCKQRKKLKPECFKFIFNKFSTSFEKFLKLWHGYRLIAVDGSNFNCPRNPQETETYHKIGDNRGYNKIHLNACYDIINGVFTACSIATSEKSHERIEFLKMLKKYPEPQKCLFIADRGYESFNILANIIERQGHFLIRARDIDSNSILKGLHLQDKGEEFDIVVNKIIVKSRKTLRHIDLEPDDSIYELYNRSIDFVTDEHPFYRMRLRILRFRLDNGCYEAVITNLSGAEASPARIKELYNMRWGIETAFRSLKYTIGGYTFHSKKLISVQQELLGKLILFNFCAFIVVLTGFKVKSNGKYHYKINMATAIKICVTYFNCGSHISVKELLQKFLIPIRKGRSSVRRKLFEQPAKVFQYRPF